MSNQEDHYYNIYDDTKPATINPFDLHTIVNSGLNYSIKDEWWAS